MTRVEDALQVPIAGSTERLPSLSGPKAPRPVVWWAGAGVAFVVLQIYVYASWVISGDAKRTPTGADPVPHATKLWAWSFQAISVTALLVVATYCIRRCRRERRLTFDAMVMIAFLLTFWQDTIINYLRPVFFYNSYLINFGAWDSHIPGWVSPHGHLVPEPVLLSGPIYGWWFVAFACLFCALARRAHARWPSMGKVGIFSIGVLALGLLDMALELTFMHGEAWAYPGVIRGLSIFGGRRYQFPMYEALVVGVFCSVIGMLRYYRDDRGRSRVERGVEDLRMSPRRRSVVSAFALVGLANVMFGVLNVGYNWVGLYVDKTPDYPSYLVNGLCGPGSGYECPAPGVPVFLPDSPRAAT